jgi:transcriptional regulator with XRE-family HTH domain
MKIQDRLAKNVRKYRKEKGYSQEEFARICGVHRTYMGLIERGKTAVSIEILEKICHSLNVSYNTIL